MALLGSRLEPGGLLAKRYNYFWFVSEDATDPQAACFNCSIPRNEHTRGRCLVSATKFALKWYKQTNNRLVYLVAARKNDARI
jgi:hypothetical protein